MNDPGGEAGIPGQGVASRSISWSSARRVLAFLLIVASAAAFVYLRASDRWRSCSTDTSTDSGVVYRDTTCEDAPLDLLIAPLLVVLGLMWPDVSEVTLLGLGSVKKQLLEQEDRQNKLDAAQQRVEMKLEAKLHVEQNQTLVQQFTTDPTLAAVLGNLIELMPNSGAGSLAFAESTQASTADRDAAAADRDRFDARVAELKPWMNVADRMSQPRFLTALRGMAPSGDLSDAPGLVETDRALLARIEPRDKPFDVDALQSWRDSNVLPLQLVAQTAREIDSATPESVRVAANLADGLWADLQGRGLLKG